MRSSIGSGPNKSIIRRRQVLSAINSWFWGGGPIGPSVQASAVVFTDKTDTTITLNWTDGNGDSRIVLMKAASAVNSNPVNGVTYTANSAFGSGSQIGTGNYVVKLGSGPVTVTGLTENTTYHVAVYEFFNPSTYNTNSPATGSVTTYEAVWNNLLVQYDFNATRSDVISHPAHTNTYDDLMRGYRAGLPNGFRAAGLNGYALEQTATTDCYTIEQGLSQYSFTSGGGVDLPFSVGVWLKCTTLADRWITGKRAATADREWDMDVSGSKLEFSLYTAGEVANRLRILCTTNLATNTWLHVVYTYDGSKTVGGLKIYVNAVNQTVSNLSAGVYAGMTAYPNSPVVLGNLATSQSSGFQGLFDQYEIFSRCLSAADVTNLYNSGTPKQKLTLTDAEFNYFESKNRILHRNGDYIFATDGGSNLLYSSDNGVNWTTNAWGAQYASGIVTVDKGVMMARIFDDGSLMFATTKAVYYSNDGLATINASTILDSAGNAFVFHTPANASFPGAHFQTLNQSPAMTLGGVEAYVWGNYCNVDLGACPVNVWSTIDKGVTVKQVYAFGQNPNFRDDGTVDGGTTGTLLGDAGNSRKCRHVHTVVQAPGSDVFYVCTGDDNGQDEINWLKLTHSAGVWTPSFVISDAVPTTKYKVGQIVFNGSDLYFSSDATGTVSVAERGVFLTSEANIGVSETQLFDVTLGAGSVGGEITNMAISTTTGKVVVTAFAGGFTNSMWICLNFGAGSLTRFIIPQGSRPGWIILDGGFFSMKIAPMQGTPLKTLWIKD